MIAHLVGKGADCVAKAGLPPDHFYVQERESVLRVIVMVNKLIHF